MNGAADPTFTPAEVQQILGRLRAGESVPGWTYTKTDPGWGLQNDNEVWNEGGESIHYDISPTRRQGYSLEGTPTTPVFNPGEGYRRSKKYVEPLALAAFGTALGYGLLNGAGAAGTASGGAGAGGAGAAGAAGTGIGGLEGAAFADLAGGMLPEFATPSLYQAGLGAVPEFVGSAAGFLGEGVASGIPAWDAALTKAASGVPSWLANAGTTALKAFEKNPLGMIAAGASLLGGDALGGGGGGGAGGGSNMPINMNLRAQRELLPQPEYKPYSGEAVMGRQFFSPVTYSNQAAAPETPVNPEPIMDVGPAKKGDGNAAGGLLELARGGRALPPRYLRGETDGMADKIPSSIDGRQPAKLSHGEFVIPADVVSHLGNGNSDAGAKVLYKMMDRVRQARTGNKKQGKQIKPEKFMPGGIAGYNGGGAVAFSGETGSAVTLPGTGDLGMTQSSTLSPWAAPYVTNMLSQGQALANMPYQAYTGPLTAGTSPLQQTAFQGAQGLGGMFDTAAAQQYMSPYMQNVVDIQAREARRQADITQQGQQAKLAQAGAFGGSRDAIMRAEGARNLDQQIGDIQARGLQSAYDRAMQQFNTQQQQNIANVNAQASLGGQQRDVEQQGINALRGEFENQRNYPYQQLSFQQGLLNKLPISTETRSPITSGLGSILGDVAGAASIYKLIGDLFPG